MCEAIVIESLRARIAQIVGISDRRIAQAAGEDARRPAFSGAGDARGVRVCGLHCKRSRFPPTRDHNVQAHRRGQSFQGQTHQRHADAGYEREFTEKTFSQIEGFGSYGFPESHTVSFALIAYASSWMSVAAPIS